MHELDSALPVHPYTGLTALGFGRRGEPIWPVLGGSVDDDPAAAAADIDRAEFAPLQEGLTRGRRWLHLGRQGYGPRPRRRHLARYGWRAASARRTRRSRPPSTRPCISSPARCPTCIRTHARTSASCRCCAPASITTSTTPRTTASCRRSACSMAPCSGQAKPITSTCSDTSTTTRPDTSTTTMAPRPPVATYPIRAKAPAPPSPEPANPHSRRQVSRPTRLSRHQAKRLSRRQAKRPSRRQAKKPSRRRVIRLQAADPRRHAESPRLSGRPPVPARQGSLCP